MTDDERLRALRAALDEARAAAERAGSDHQRVLVALRALHSQRDDRERRVRELEDATERRPDGPLPEGLGELLAAAERRATALAQEVALLRERERRRAAGAAELSERLAAAVERQRGLVAELERSRAEVVRLRRELGGSGY